MKKTGKCETCGKPSTRFYKVRKRIQNGANSYMGYEYCESCDSCFMKMIYGKNKKEEE